jgi:hypothetical protein
MRVASGNAKPVFTLRLNKSIVARSKDIPFFRRNLELYAEKLYSDFLESECKGENL